MKPEPAMICFALAIVFAAAAVDVRSRRIPNAITYTSALVPFAFRAIRGDFDLLLPTLAGLLLGLGLLFVPWMIGGMGAGDVKLMGAVGSALGPSVVWNVFLYSLIAGGLVALVSLALRGDLVRGIKNTGSLILRLKNRVVPSGSEAPQKRFEPVGRIPFGVAIAIGTVSALFPMIRA
ncbi:MAG: prepilin peptidase [Candidatus Eisenbacteria bacterium]